MPVTKCESESVSGSESEYIPNHTHQVCNRHAHTGQHNPLVLVGDVVVVPDVQDDARG